MLNVAETTAQRNVKGDAAKLSESTSTFADAFAGVGRMCISPARGSMCEVGGWVDGRGGLCVSFRKTGA